MEIQSEYLKRTSSSNISKHETHTIPCTRLASSMRSPKTATPPVNHSDACDAPKVPKDQGLGHMLQNQLESRFRTESPSQIIVPDLVLQDPQNAPQHFLFMPSPFQSRSFQKDPTLCATPANCLKTFSSPTTTAAPWPLPMPLDLSRPKQ